MSRTRGSSNWPAKSIRRCQSMLFSKSVAALNARRKAVNGAKVLVLGLAYKADVDDDRESPSYVLMTLLKERGAAVSYYDPYVPVIKLTREHPQWAGVKSVGGT